MIPFLTRLPLWARIVLALVVIGVALALVSGLYRVAAAALMGLGAMLFGGAKMTAATTQAKVDATNADRDKREKRAQEIVDGGETTAAAVKKPAAKVDGNELLKSLGGE